MVKRKCKSPRNPRISGRNESFRGETRASPPTFRTHRPNMFRLRSVASVVFSAASNAEIAMSAPWGAQKQGLPPSPHRNRASQRLRRRAQQIERASTELSGMLVRSRCNKASTVAFPTAWRGNRGQRQYVICRCCRPTSPANQTPDLK